MTSTPIDGPVAHDASCTCRLHPLPAGMAVEQARDAYLAENGFTTEGYTAPKTKGSIFGVSVSVPNPPAHQRGIRLHDLLHVATGYGTDHAGEAEISAWQLRRGLRGAGAYVGAIVLFNVAVGVLVAPSRTWSAAREGVGRGSLFSTPVGYAELLALTVGELRAMLGIPELGVAKGPRGLHARAPSTA